MFIFAQMCSATPTRDQCAKELINESFLRLLLFIILIQIQFNTPAIDCYNALLFVVFLRQRANTFHGQHCGQRSNPDILGLASLESHEFQMQKTVDKKGHLGKFLDSMSQTSLPRSITNICVSTVSKSAQRKGNRIEFPVKGWGYLKLV